MDDAEEASCAFLFDICKIWSYNRDLSAEVRADFPVLTLLLCAKTRELVRKATHPKKDTFHIRCLPLCHRSFYELA
jgi:hypothetical protein